MYGTYITIHIYIIELASYNISHLKSKEPMKIATQVMRVTLFITILKLK